MHLSNHIPLHSALDEQCSNHNGLLIPTAGPLHLLFSLPGSSPLTSLCLAPLLQSALITHAAYCLRSKTPVSQVDKVPTQIKLMPYSTTFPYFQVHTISLYLAYYFQSTQVPPNYISGASTLPESNSGSRTVSHPQRKRDQNGVHESQSTQQYHDLWSWCWDSLWPVLFF